jgi:hypothetical protein
VGPLIWADDDCVDATLGGFVEALRRKEREGIVEKSFLDAFLRHCTSLGEEALSERFHALTAAYDPSAPDMPIIRRHMATHALTFQTALRNLADL